MPQEPLFMEHRAMMFLRHWSAVPEVLRPVSCRFLDLGLMEPDPQLDPSLDDWPYRLTERGEALKDLVDGQSFNFFVWSQLKYIFPDGDHAKKADRIFKDKMPIAASGVRPSGHPTTSGLFGALGRLEDACDRLGAAVNRTRIMMRPHHEY